MQPHVVSVKYNHFGADEDGGRRVAAPGTGVGLRCFVQPGEARTIVDTADATGQSRVTEFNPTKVYFVDDAALSSQDLIEWVDAVGVNHIYLVVGYYPPCGTSVMWNAVCQERV
jgi:hypothetical protein